ncbi:hypothetical protein ACKC9G_13290 [Pokkaliibacter sp. CJK22405]|uniref:hypothetical protein n=1 Tax=Pokkaliibacter sp. CJK22405 TaxID=3384615 RepID=UPI00398548E8
MAFPRFPLSLILASLMLTSAGASHAQTLSIPPKPDSNPTYATASRTVTPLSDEEVRFQRQALEALMAKSPAMVDKIQTTPQKYAPPILFGLGFQQFEAAGDDKDKAEQAMFWMTAGYLRALSDAEKLADSPIRGRMESWVSRYLGQPYAQAVGRYRGDMQALVKQVTAWDTTTPRDYHPGWLGWMQPDAPAQAFALEPEAKWPAIDAKARVALEKAVLADLKQRQ